jgi:hypothetical protein
MDHNPNRPRFLSNKIPDRVIFLGFRIDPPPITQGGPSNTAEPLGMPPRLGLLVGTASETDWDTPRAVLVAVAPFNVTLNQREFFRIFP